MRFQLPFASCFLFVFAVFADPRREHRRSRFLSHRDLASLNLTQWAGAMWNQDPGTFTSMTGTFEVPLLTGQSGASASIWLGMDGNDDTCNRGFFQAGVDCYVGGSYFPWVEWSPDVQSIYFDNFPISTRDEIRVNLTALSSTTGIATIENLSNGQHVSKEVSSAHALCGQSAEWIVEDFDDGSHHINPLGNFATVIIRGANAAGPHGTFTPNGATLIDIQQNNTVMTSISLEGDDLVVTYVGH